MLWVLLTKEIFLFLEIDLYLVFKHGKRNQRQIVTYKNGHQFLLPALTMFRQVKECDEERLVEQLSQLAEELGEEMSDDVVDESEGEDSDNDSSENDDCERES
jgi:hypothetical protein